MRQVLLQKKSTLWLLIMAAVILVGIAALCLTDKSDDSRKDEAYVGTEVQGNLSGEEVLEASAAQELYEAANPYVGDASANGNLLNVIGMYTGGLDMPFTTELQTAKEPYTITLHFEEKPEETKVFKSAILFLALTENCDEVCWDYPGDATDVLTHTNDIRPAVDTELEAESVPIDRITCYITTEDANASLNIENIKEYAASPKKVAKLLELLEAQSTQAYYGKISLETDDTELTD